MSAVAHFFMSVGGSKIHERLAHFFIDIYKKPSIYAGLRRLQKSFDNNLITAIQDPLFLQSGGLWVTE